MKRRIAVALAAGIAACLAVPSIGGFPLRIMNSKKKMINVIVVPPGSPSPAGSPVRQVPARQGTRSETARIKFEKLEAGLKVQEMFPIFLARQGNMQERLVALQKQRQDDILQIANIQFTFREFSKKTIIDRTKHGVMHFLNSFEWFHLAYALNDDFSKSIDAYMESLEGKIVKDGSQEKAGEESTYSLSFSLPEQLFPQTFTVMFQTSFSDSVYINGKSANIFNKNDYVLLPAGKYRVDYFPGNGKEELLPGGGHRYAVFSAPPGMNIELRRDTLAPSDMDKNGHNEIDFGQGWTRPTQFQIKSATLADNSLLVELNNGYFGCDSRSGVLRSLGGLASDAPLSAVIMAKGDRVSNDVYYWISKSGGLIKVYFQQKDGYLMPVIYRNNNKIHNTDFQPILADDCFLVALDLVSDNTTELRSIYYKNETPNWKQTYSGKGLLLASIGKNILFAHGQPNSSTVHLKKIDLRDGTSKWEKDVEWSDNIILENDADLLLVKGGNPTDPAEIIDTETNKLIAKVQMEEGIEIIDVAIENKTALFLTSDKQLMAFDLNDNRQLWSRLAPNWITTKSKIVALEKNYTIISTSLEASDTDKAKKLNKKSAAIVTIFSTKTGEILFFEDAEIGSPPVKLAENLVFLPFSNGTATIYDIEKQYACWRYTTWEAKYGEDETTALVGEDRIYIISTKHNKIECMPLPINAN